jgi:hypothetical protein
MFQCLPARADLSFVQWFVATGFNGNEFGFALLQVLPKQGAPGVTVNG